MPVIITYLVSDPRTKIIQSIVAYYVIQCYIYRGIEGLLKWSGWIYN